MTKIETTIHEYLGKVDEICGLYLDSIHSYYALRSRMKELNKGRSEDFIIQMMDGNPDHPDTKEVHRTPLGPYLKRLDINGQDQRAIGNYCIVMIYQLWEDEYRKRVSTVSGNSINEIRSDTLGELRQIRNGIIHNNGIKTSDFKKVKTIELMDKDEIQVTAEQFQDMINLLKEDLKQLILKYQDSEN